MRKTALAQMRILWHVSIMSNTKNITISENHLFEVQCAEMAKADKKGDSVLCNMWLQFITCARQNADDTEGTKDDADYHFQITRGSMDEESISWANDYKKIEDKASLKALKTVVTKLNKMGYKIDNTLGVPL